MRPNWKGTLSKNSAGKRCGWWGRSVVRGNGREIHSQETTTWVSSRDPDGVTTEQIAGLRHHWTIENGVFYVRDVSYGEDRSHARLIGVVMSAIRNLAISIIRRAEYPYMTDAWADISSLPDLGFSLLLK